MLLKREIYSYALACVNFYGLITLRELAQVINHYEKTNYQAKDLEELLHSYLDEENFVQKTGRILYQKQMFENTDVKAVYELLKHKPLYYYEDKEQLLNHIQASYYELPNEFNVLKDFFAAWMENEDMAFVMAKNCVMAFNVDVAITEMNEAMLARMNDYLNLIKSPHYFDDVSRNALIVNLINLNHAVRKISLRGFSAKEIDEKRVDED